MTRISTSNKYGAVRTWSYMFERWFASGHEANRAHELGLLQYAGDITELQFQPKFTLDESKPKMTYSADFKYYDLKTDKWVYEDAKGQDTRASKVSRRWVKQKYGIEVKLV